MKQFLKWDLSGVLRGMTRSLFEPIANTTVLTVTFKGVFLVAITLARRVSEPQALSVRVPYLSVFADRIILKVDTSFLPKVFSTFHCSQEIIYPSFAPDPSNRGEEAFHFLDVRKSLLAYLDGVASFQKSDTLFVSVSGPSKGRQASTGTIARWIRTSSLEAYQVMAVPLPLDLKAHSARALAAT